MTESSHALYLPCELIRVRALVTEAKVLTPIEQLVLTAIGTAAEALPFSEVVEMFGLGERPTLDLVRDLWSTGHITVVPERSTVRLSPATQRRLDEGTLGRVEAARWDEERHEVLRDLVTGSMIRGAAPGGVRTGYRVPEEVPLCGGRLNEAQAAELTALLSRLVRKSPGGQERRLLQVFPIAAPEGMAPERRVIRIRARVTKDAATGALRFEVQHPRSIPALVRNRIGEQLSRSAETHADQYVFRNLNARVSVTVARAVDPLAHALERLRRSVDELDVGADEDLDARHHECMDAAREAMAACNVVAQPASKITVLRGTGDLNEHVRDAIRTAREQIVLVCPFADWSGIERFRDNLIEAVRPPRQIRVFVLWSTGEGVPLDEFFARGLMQVDAAAHRKAVLRPAKSSNIHAKLVVRDFDRAIVGSSNYLSEAGGAAEIGVIIEAKGGDQPCGVVVELLKWIWTRTPEQSMRDVLRVPTADAAAVTTLRIPEWDGLRSQPITGDERHAFRLEWEQFVDRVESLVASFEANPTATFDNDHRSLLLRAFREAKWRLLISSDRLGDGGLDPSIERLLRERLQEGLPVALVWRRQTTGKYSRALAERLDQMAAEFPTLFLVHGDNHAKVLVWDDYAVVSSFNFLSFGGDFEGGRRRRPWGEVGVCAGDAETADSVIWNLAVQLGGGLSEWETRFVRPEQPTQEVEGSALFEDTPAAIRQLLKGLRERGDEPELRKPMIQLFFSEVSAPAEALRTLEGMTALSDSEIRLARLCALRRREVRSDVDGARWVASAAYDLWQEGEFFAASALLARLNGSGDSGVRVPPLPLALAASVASAPKALIERVLEVLTGVSEGCEAEEGVLILATRSLVVTGEPDLASMLNEASESPVTLAHRTADAVLRTWWAQTMQAVPRTSLEQQGYWRDAQAGLSAARDEVFAAFKRGEALIHQLHKFPVEALHVAEKLFGKAGLMRDLVTAVEQRKPKEVKDLHAGLSPGVDLVCGLWDELRRDRLESPLRDKLVRPVEGLLEAAGAWADAASPPSTSLTPHSIAALNGLRTELERLWPELEAAAGASEILGPLYSSLLDVLKPVVEWTAPVAEDPRT